ELIQYHSKEVFNIKEEEYIYKLLSNEGIFEEKENLIIIMGDSLYNIKIETLTNTFRGKILKEELDKLESIKYLYNNKNVQLVLRVPIGSIKFSSNREYIVLENEKTQDYLLQCIKEFFEDYKKKFIDKLKKYKNIKIEDLFELDLDTKENTHLLNIKGIYIRELDLKVITS
ncbi:hypothetical protein RZS08_58975, partial [Arthrospira platensis SPKY1]|nr:hypothetical protein [Arthrospira platensis SPKY1]